jgi:hypothetical protein
MSIIARRDTKCLAPTKGTSEIRRASWALPELK